MASTAQQQRAIIEFCDNNINEIRRIVYMVRAYAYDHQVVPADIVIDAVHWMNGNPREGWMLAQITGEQTQDMTTVEDDEASGQTYSDILGWISWCAEEYSQFYSVTTEKISIRDSHMTNGNWLSIKFIHHN